MLSRIAQELFWLGRNITRAEHTTRMLDGVFQASLQSTSDGSGSGSVQLGWRSILAIMGAEPGLETDREAVMRRMTVDPNEPASVVSCVARAREGARTVRDVISAEMWEAVNTTNLRLAGGDLSAGIDFGPYAFFQYVKERSALFWGLTSRTMLRDDAAAFLIAGGRFESADMVLRMLRVTLPSAATNSAGAGAPGGLLDGQAQALLQAVGGFQAFRRSVPLAAHAGPVTHFLLYERRYPDSVAASVETVGRQLSRADESPRRSEPVLRLQRLGADLEFRGRGPIDHASIAETCSLVQKELSLTDQDIAARYFTGSKLQSGTVLA